MMTLADIWQPIETAPMDGTPILIWVDGRLHEARWDADAIKPLKFQSDDDDEGWWQIRWAEISSYGVPAEEMPTHWMPLPEPPG